MCVEERLKYAECDFSIEEILFFWYRGVCDFAGKVQAKQLRDLPKAVKEPILLYCREIFCDLLLFF